METASEPGGPRELAARLRAMARLIAEPLLDAPLWHAVGLSRDPEWSGSPDDWAATHYRVMTHDLLPAAGVFLEERGMLGGVVGRAVHDQMLAAGFEQGSGDLTPDHAARELAFMAYLLETGRKPALIDFWYGHAAGWMPLLPVLWASSGEPLFIALGEALGRASSELEAHTPPADPPGDVVPEALASARIDMDDEKVGLAQIGTFLAVPARSGLLLTRSWMSSAGRRFRLPTGFGSRLQIAEGLLRSAAQYDAMTDVCDLLDEAVTGMSRLWTERLSADAIWANRWLERLELTRTVVARLRQGA
jgi:hypothetical protein